MLRSIRKLAGRWRSGASEPVEAQVKAIDRLGVFDREAYLAVNRDVAESGIDPIQHYVTTGAREGRNPCAYFDSAYYLAINPDVASGGLNPLLHYFEFGWREGRDPSADFDAAWYAARHLPDAGGNVNPLGHYLSVGREQQLEIRAVTDIARQAIAESGLFDADYYGERYPDVAATGADLAQHYLRYGADEGRNPNAFFHTRHYLKKNPDVAATRVNPLVHFAQSGWKELRNPHPDFDVWWYWSMYLDPSKEDINPLAHYLAIGHAQQLDRRPPRRVSQAVGSGFRFPAGAVVRRICLFAGYDPHGMVDDYVVEYLRELSRYADIHYLADCDMQPGELDKLAGIVKSATSERHGEYDFGSYSRLVRQVGWDVIESYDELILANDSCYLLRELQHVFAKMDGKPCDWWGMQATKGMAATRRNPRNRFLQPIPMTAVRGSMLGGFEQDYRYEFHIGTYFVAYRQPVIRDLQFRKLLDSVVGQNSKANVVAKYEIGLTRSLIARGFAFETFVDYLYPFHPIYTNWYFRLLEEGFPFLKRYLLAENHYRISGLGAWMDRILRKLPGANLDAIRNNLQRVVEPEKLHANLYLGGDPVVDLGSEPEVLLGKQDFMAADRAAPKFGHWWAFPVCAFTGVFAGNERAVFEEVKDDPSIKKIILTRSEQATPAGTNVEVVPLQSPRGQYLLMRSGNIFIKHSPTRNLIYPVAPDLHNIINLWHGIPFKRIGYASLDMQHMRQAIAHEHHKCRATICSSQVDRLAMTAAFYPLSYGEVWPTGLPRNDFILRDFERLPEDLREQADRLRDEVAGRKLVLFMPTFRNAQEEAYYAFSPDEVEWLGEWLTRNNAVLGLREHMADSARTYTNLLGSLNPLDLGDSRYPNVEILYRGSDALITDYSSSFIDYMLTGKPAISFAYDYESYALVERGAFYDLEFVFPGPVCRDFSQLCAALDRVFEPRSDVDEAARDWKRKLFFDHIDDRNSARLVALVSQLTDCGDIGKRGLAIGI
jgi:CDP-glycerol glycerophosphotransferase (TagB/SpsB family)